jgi:hypothetical protein
MRNAAYREVGISAPLLALSCFALSAEIHPTSKLVGFLSNANALKYLLNSNYFMIQGYPLKIDYEAHYRKPSEPLETVVEMPSGKKGKVSYLKGYLYETKEGFHILAPGLASNPYIWIPGKDAKSVHIYRTHNPDSKNQNLNLVLPGKINVLMENATYEKDMHGNWHLICRYKAPEMHLDYSIDVKLFPNLTCELYDISWQNPSTNGNSISKLLLRKNGIGKAIVFEVPKLLDNFAFYYEPSLSDKKTSEDQIYHLRLDGQVPEKLKERVENLPEKISQIDLERIVEGVISDMKVLSKGRAYPNNRLKSSLDYLDVLKDSEDGF